MLLAHLAYPNRLSDLAMKFGCTTVQSFIHSKWKHLLEWDHVRLTPERLAQYARTIERKGALIGTVWGFIDGIIRAIRKHCLKYYAIVTPDGLISHLFGPVDGQRNDAFLWKDSNLPTILQKYAHAPDGTALQKLWNQVMSQLHIVMEWAFKEMINMFGFLDYVKNQKHLLQPIGVQFRVATLLHNAHYFENLHNVGVEAPVEEMIEDQLLQLSSLLEYFHD
ncbi:hypothetical protein L873DRAFT_1836727 [Choiromyces venosus 120613-1]|uniref:DDE Tnp4 domain-containing protein n=1 Tax=Choiromyces venosus 120613-1 TaxID=1336337 RepID=A0A3N4JIL0_9PEZI|nr:hypothetical protein L873DRAFT_1836727 [Choiromyces venosus 120613-1]